MATPPITSLTEQANKVITVNFGGRFFRCSQRTYAACLELQAAVSAHKPGAFVVVIQGSYNTGVALSAGTHDKDATLDIKIVGFTWQDMESFCRKMGWAAWWRHTGSWASPSAFHIHMTLLGAQEAGCEVGTLIPGQVADYKAHRTGLVGHLPDPTWHPKNIASTVFDYQTYLEDNMPLSDKDIARIADAVAPKVAAAVLNAQVGPADDLTAVRTALYRASNVPDLIRAKTASAVDAITTKLSQK